MTRSICLIALFSAAALSLAVFGSVRERTGFASVQTYSHALPEPASECAFTESTETTEAATETQPAVRGDIVQDGSVNVVDIIALQKHLLNLQPLTAEQAAAADLNADGAVDIFDLGNGQ